jgi:hypothetical protein
MIWEFCPSILDCCALLIPSSNPNNRRVQIASNATPPTTSTLAIDHFGDSITMPIATAKLATIATDKSIMWGHNGSSEPEKNVLIYFYLAAAGSWFGVAVIAILKLVWVRRKKHQR